MTYTAESQSLLYQGFVSTATFRDIARTSPVSIPSLSGLRFNRSARGDRDRIGRLNPFFIRASFQQ